MKFILMLFFLFGCTNLEFVYEKKDKNFLKNSTSLDLQGDRESILYSQLVDLIGNGVERKYILKANIKETISKEIIKSDSTTSKYTVSHTINYTLTRIEKKCSILEKKITTTSNYNSKSAGYNFGTDISKTKTIESNIVANIESFLKTASAISNPELCKNEG